MACCQRPSECRLLALLGEASWSCTTSDPNAHGQARGKEGSSRFVTYESSGVVFLDRLTGTERTLAALEASNLLTLQSPQFL